MSIPSSNYTMYPGTERAQVYELTCRSGPRMGFYHDVKFRSPSRITQWHGYWHFDRAMQTFQAGFKYNYPDCQKLVSVSLSRRWNNTFVGHDAKGRHISMKLICFRTYFGPSRRWIAFDVF